MGIKRYSGHCPACDAIRPFVVMRYDRGQRVLNVLTLGLIIPLWNFYDFIDTDRYGEREPVRCKGCGGTVAWVRVKKGIFGWKQISDPLDSGIPLNAGSKTVEETAPEPGQEPPEVKQMPQHAIGRWGTDPSGQFAKRWFDGKRWTEHVETAEGKRASDPPPSKYFGPE